MARPFATLRAVASVGRGRSTVELETHGPAEAGSLVHVPSLLTTSVVAFTRRYREGAGWRSRNIQGDAGAPANGLTWQARPECPMLARRVLADALRCGAFELPEEPGHG
ncbi:hypothetical protein AKJ08_1192 [Vulgatibacter incomptus]|uniref:Uncharacterized protein n=1 Tax=Vulgatibacter incomptus TaxID=1391653 RepID=A0A0K1PBA7_9BACT|nr:hypothetical protein AKJ08_1192 [Vulgatibacter incomptus]